MGVCEMCGSSGPLARAIIENVQFSVCKTCAKLGKVITLPRFETRPQKIAPKRAPQPVVIERLVEDFAQKIRSARESSKLTQKAFAAKLSERESMLSKVEAGDYEPPIATARRWARILRVRLVTQETEEASAVIEKAGKNGPLTIGDIIKIQK